MQQFYPSIISISPVNAKRPCSPQHGQTPSHAQAIPQNIQLTPLDLFPSNGDFDHGDAGRFGQHQHFDVEDPALGMHVGDDVRERRTREELEAALGIADSGRGGRSEKAEEEMEGVHEEVAEE